MPVASSASSRPSTRWRGGASSWSAAAPEAAAKVRLLSETKAEIVVYAASLDKETGADLSPPMPTGAGPGRASPISPAPRWSLPPPATRTSDREIWSLAHEAGVPVNVVDRPELCDFYTPAIVNRAPLAVAVGSEGVAPVLSRHVRARIEALLAPAFGDLAGLADRLRDRVARALPSGRERRRFWARFFSGPVAEKVFAGEHGRGRGRGASACSRSARNLSGHVSLVGAGPGAEDLLTLRAQRALQEADVIVYDRLVPDAIVAQGRRDARRIYVGKAHGQPRRSARTRSTRSSSARRGTATASSGSSRAIR